ncbi:MAG TPA: D-xylose transporter XylE [bacterium]|nr:D-xylose transporter XylE [bacterium]
MKNKHSGTVHALLYTLIATLGGLLFGYDTAVISGTVRALEVFFIQPYGLSENAANSLLGRVVSSALLGCIFGGFLGGFLSTKFGRKKGLIFAAVLFLISAIGSAIPELFFLPPGKGNHLFLNAFVIYRVIGGIGVGMASLLSPMYIAEISPAHLRGRLVTLNNFAVIWGVLVVYFVNYGIALQGDDAWLNQVGWRWMFASEIIPAGLFLICLIFIPETPRYLVMSGNPEKAFNILAKINGPNAAGRILNEINSTIAQKSGRLFSYGYKVIITGTLVAVFQQITGINVVVYYAPEIFRNMGAKTDTAFLQTVVIGIINVLASIAALFVVDKIKRKTMLMIGTLGITFFMFALGFSFYFQKLGLPAIIFVIGYAFFFQGTWGCVAWILISEMYPNIIRGRAMGVSVAILWISNYIVSWTFPIMDKSTFLTNLFNKAFSYWIYGAMGLLAFLFIWKMVPETKGKTLEEIENYWKK